MFLPDLRKWEQFECLHDQSVSVLPLAQIHAFRRAGLDLLGADVLPVGRQHRAVGLLERLGHGPPHVLVRVAEDVLEEPVGRRVAVQLLLLLRLLHLRLDLVPVLPALGRRVRRPQGAGAGGGAAPAPRRRRGDEPGLVGELQRCPRRPRLRLGEADLDLGGEDGEPALVGDDLAEQAGLQVVRRLAGDLDGDAQQLLAELHSDVLGGHALGEHGHHHLRRAVVVVVPVLGLISRSGRGGGDGGGGARIGLHRLGRLGVNLLHQLGEPSVAGGQGGADLDGGPGGVVLLQLDAGVGPAEVRSGHGGVELSGAGGVRGGRGEISHLDVGLGAIGIQRGGGGARGDGLRVERGGEGEVVVDEGLLRLVLQLGGRRRRHGCGVRRRKSARLDRGRIR